jgi:hypothetical protein
VLPSIPKGEIVGKLVVTDFKFRRSPETFKNNGYI